MGDGEPMTTDEYLAREHQQQAPVKIIALAEWRQSQTPVVSKALAARWAQAGRLSGAYQSTDIWLLPEKTPRPPDQRGRPRKTLDK